MIPAFGLGEVLPPFLGSDPGTISSRSPYPATIEDFVDSFCTSRERAAVLRGFLDLRTALRTAGFSAGFHWIDGSFVENCEVSRGRAPADMDVVSILRRPPGVASLQDWVSFVNQHAGTLFNPHWTKATFHCDSYYIDLDSDPEVVVEATAYWIGLFSHQRDSFRWKGLVRVEFGPGDDADALALIEAREQAW